MRSQLRRAISTYLKPSDSVISTRPLSTQVRHFPSHSPNSPFYHSNTSHFFNANQKLYFSSKPNSIVETVLSNEWSTALENSLENSDRKWTHEGVVYVLKNLDKDPKKAWNFFNWVTQKNGFRPTSSLYGLVLRALVNMESKKLFWVALSRMREDRVCLDGETFKTLMGVLKKVSKSDAVCFKDVYDKMVEDKGVDVVVKTVVDVILEAGSSDEVERELGEMEIVLSDSFVIRVLKELRKQPLKALEFFRWVGSHQGYGHNAITYNAIARVLGRDDAIEEFWSLVEEMKNAGYEMDLDTYIKLSRQLQKYRLMEDAVKLYEFMMDGPFKPSVQDCNILLRSISHGDKPDSKLVHRVVKKYEETGYSLSKAVYDGMHRSFTSAGKFDEAENVVNAMRNAGFEPDNITYSQLVFGLCKAKRLEEARNVVENMEVDGCVPDIITWTILIQGLCVENQVDRALMCLAKMMEKGCDPDADLLGVLIDGFLIQKRINGAYTFLVEMVNKALFRPWRDTYKLVIEKLLDIRKLEEALNLLRLMKKHNYPPVPEPFVQYISKFGTVENAAEFLQALTVKDCPSFASYLHVFESFFGEGRLSEAQDLLYKCPYHIRKHRKICELFGSTKSADVTA